MSKTQRSSDQQLYQLPICSICLSPLSHNITSVNCGHVFHHQCISKYFSKYSEKCPNCQKTCQAKDLVQLVFQSHLEKLDNFANRQQLENYEARIKQLTKQNQNLFKQWNLKEKQLAKLRIESAENNGIKLKNQQVEIQTLHKLVSDMSQEQSESQRTMNALKREITKLGDEIRLYKNNIYSTEMKTSEALKFKKELQKLGKSEAQKADAYFQMLILKAGNQTRHNQVIKQLKDKIYQLQNEIAYKNTLIKSLQEDLAEIKGLCEENFKQFNNDLLQSFICLVDPDEERVHKKFQKKIMKKFKKIKFGNQALKKKSINDN